jgi:hypothetical protein
LGREIRQFEITISPAGFTHAFQKHVDTSRVDLANG